MKDRLGTDEVDGLNDDEWKCFKGDAEVDCIYVLMCKIVKNSNEAHNFLKVKIFDDNRDLEEKKEFLVTNCFLYDLRLIGDVANDLFGWLTILFS